MLEKFAQVEELTASSAAPNPSPASTPGLMTGSARSREAERAASEMASQLGGRRALDEFTVEKFNPSDGTRSAFDACRSFNPDTDNIYIHGPTGTGKTHLATIAVRQHRHPHVTKPINITRHIRSCESARDEHDAIRWYVDERILLVDDLGVGKDTEFAVTTIYEIIDGRYRAMSGGLIITSNLSLDALAQKLGDDRIPSRLAQMCRVFFISGPDHRLEARP